MGITRGSSKFTFLLSTPVIFGAIVKVKELIIGFNLELGIVYLHCWYNIN